MTDDFKNERDALCMLGLLSHMHKNFDKQIDAPDKQPTHTHGLNIHAVIIDNVSGHVLGLKQNSIHEYNDPMLHAEQLTLKEAIEEKNRIQPRDPATTSVEQYYRNLLFNDPASTDMLNSGATIYTTLEPCPFCTSALLVCRMKRIVFITPDVTYGNSFTDLWNKYYRKYDIHYEQFNLGAGSSEVIDNARIFSTNILKKIAEMKDMAGTLYFDHLYPELTEIADYFKKVNDSMLITVGDENKRNSKLLADLQQRIVA